MGDSVTVRVANRLGDAESAAFAGLIRDLVRRDAAMFSMSLSSDTVNLVDEAAGKDLEDLGFDSVVLTGEPFLDTVNRAGGATWELVSAVHSVQELPDSIRGQLLPNLGCGPRREKHRMFASTAAPVRPQSLCQEAGRERWTRIASL